MKNNYNVNMTGLSSLELGTPLASVDIEIGGNLKRLQMPTNPSSGILFIGPMTTETRDNLTAQYNIRNGAIIYNVSLNQLQTMQAGAWTAFVTEAAFELYAQQQQNSVLALGPIGKNIVAVEPAPAVDQVEDQQEDGTFTMNKRGCRHDLHARIVKSGKNRSNLLNRKSKSGVKQRALINSNYLNGYSAFAFLQVNPFANEVIPAPLVQDEVPSPVGLDPVINRKNLCRKRKFREAPHDDGEMIDIMDLIDPEIFTIENANKPLQFDETGTVITVANVVYIVDIIYPLSKFNINVINN